MPRTGLHGGRWPYSLDYIVKQRNAQELNQLQSRFPNHSPPPQKKKINNTFLGCFQPSLYMSALYIQYNYLLLTTITVSTSFLCSKSTALSFTSGELSHDLIWSRNRCNFFISFFKSSSYFSCKVNNIQLNIIEIIR